MAAVERIQLILKFLVQSARNYCNTSFSINLGTLITLKWLFLRFKVI